MFDITTMTSVLRKVPVSKGIQLAKVFAVKNHKEILVLAGGTGTLVAMVVAVKEGYKADKVIAEVRLERNEELTVPETIAIAAPYFTAPALIWLASMAMIIFATVEFRNENAALAAAYALSEVSSDKNIKKLKEIAGFEEPASEKDSSPKEEKITRTPAESGKLDETDGAEYHCYEPYCGQEFMASPSRIYNVISELNYEMSRGHDSEPSLNQFYFKMDLPQTELGADNGWNVDDGMIDVRLSSVMRGDHQPYIEIEFNPKPSPDYLNSRY